MKDEWELCGDHYKGKRNYQVIKQYDPKEKYIKQLSITEAKSVKSTEAAKAAGMVRTGSHGAFNIYCRP